MFSSGFKIGRVFGIDIIVHATWILVFFLLAVSFGETFGTYTTDPGPYSSTFPGGIWPWVAGVFTALVFFACLLAHELSHSFVAKRKGIEVKRITLFIFGGIAEMSGEIEDAGSEFKVAIAGPLASFIISGLLFGLYFLAFHMQWNAIYIVPISYLAFLNLGVGVFNLLPGFPMDGGRVLRSAIWKKTGDLKKSTKISTLVGKGLAVLMGTGGLYLIFTKDYTSGIWLVFIGVFLYQLANMSFKQTLLRLAATDTKVEDIMFTDVPVVDAYTTLTSLKINYFGPYRLPALPVKDGESFIGLVIEKDLENVAQAEWDILNAGRIARPVPPEKIVPPDTPLSKVLSKISGFNDFILIVSENDILGILTKQELVRYFEMRVKLQGK